MLANTNEVTGFTIGAPGTNGIFGSGVGNFLIQQTTIIKTGVSG